MKVIDIKKSMKICVLLVVGLLMIANNALADETSFENGILLHPYTLNIAEAYKIKSDILEKRINVVSLKSYEDGIISALVRRIPLSKQLEDNTKYMEKATKINLCLTNKAYVNKIFKDYKEGILYGTDKYSYYFIIEAEKCLDLE